MHRRAALKNACIDGHCSGIVAVALSGCAGWCAHLKHACPALMESVKEKGEVWKQIAGEGAKASWFMSMKGRHGVCANKSRSAPRPHFACAGMKRSGLGFRVCSLGWMIEKERSVNRQESAC